MRTFHENVALLWACRHEIYRRPEFYYAPTGDSYIGGAEFCLGTTLHAMEGFLFQFNEGRDILFSFVGNPLSGTTVGHCFSPDSGRIHRVVIDGFMPRFKALRSAQATHEAPNHPAGLPLEEVVARLETEVGRR